MLSPVRLPPLCKLAPPDTTQRFWNISRTETTYDVQVDVSMMTHKFSWSWQPRSRLSFDLQGVHGHNQGQESSSPLDMMVLWTVGTCTSSIRSQHFKFRCSSSALAMVQQPKYGSQNSPVQLHTRCSTGVRKHYTILAAEGRWSVGCKRTIDVHCEQLFW
jgi:hypothetical protein